VLVDRLSDVGQGSVRPDVAFEHRRGDALDPDGARPLGQPAQQRGANPAPLPCVGDHVGHLRLLGVAWIDDVARDADPLAGLGVERADRLAPAVVDPGQLLELVAVNAFHLRAETPVARHRAEVLEPDFEQRGVMRLDRPDCHLAPVLEQHPLAPDARGGWLGRFEHVHPSVRLRRGRSRAGDVLFECVQLAGEAGELALGRAPAGGHCP
jgi:hypothetical protein